MEIDSGSMSEPETTFNRHSTPPSSTDDDPEADEHASEQFSQMDTHIQHRGATNYYQTSVTSSTSTCGSVTASGNAKRRHTVGLADVTYEQSLSSTQNPMINFKFGGDPHQLATNLHHHHQPDATHLLPINLPTLQNQPLTNFSMKNHLLLKPPTVMENSEWFII